MNKKIDEKIAIVGIGFQLPGECTTLEGIYYTLKNKKCHIKETDISSMVGFDDSLLVNRVVPTMAKIDKNLNFEFRKLRVNPKEEMVMDIQQKLLLYYSQKAIEDSGETLENLFNSQTAVIVGCGEYDFREQLVVDMKNASPYSITGSFSTFLANKISYYFNLSGPSFVVDSACSSSLVALVNGVNLIQSGDCDSAIVCGVNVITNAFNMLSYYNSGLLSPDGKSRPFLQNSNGFIRAEGCICLYIKKIKEDYKGKIYATLLGGTTNHGGKSSSLIAPNNVKQTQLMKHAIDKSSITANDINYFEMHCTGTSLGDETEMNAIYNLVNNKAQKVFYAGSAKGNFGHLEGAAGLAGVIKVLAMMKYKKTTPQIGEAIHINQKLQNEKIKVNFDEEFDWPEKDQIAIINSFGIGGANASVVLSGNTDSYAAESVQNFECHLYEKVTTPYIENFGIDLKRKKVFFGINDEFNFGKYNCICEKYYSFDKLKNEVDAGCRDVYILLDCKNNTDSKETFLDAIRLLKAIAELSFFNEFRIYYVLTEESVDYIGAILGLVQSSVIEYKNLSGAVISIADSESLFCEIFKIQASKNINLVRIDENIKTVDLYKQVIDQKILSSSIKKNGTYVIFGGASGVGYEVAKYLTEKYQCDLIIVGRSHKNLFIKQLDVLNQNKILNIKYIQCDVENSEDFSNNVVPLLLKEKKVDGVFFSIPTIHDGLLVEISEEVFIKSIFKKFDALLHISNVFSSLKLDFFTFILSINGVVGSKGGCVYSASNSQFNYATNLLSKRFDTNVYSIMFGIWKNVGLSNKYSEIIKRANIGLDVFNAPEGIEAIETIINNNINNSLFFKGQNSFLRGHMCYGQLLVLDLYAVLSFIMLSRSRNNNGVCSIKELLNFPENYKQLQEAIENILSFYGIHNLQHEFFQITIQKLSLFTQNIKNELLKLDATYIGYVNLLDHVLDNFYDVIHGKKHYTDVLFSDNFANFQKIYSNNTYFDEINSEVAQHIANTAQKMRKKIKILEIGAGIGGTTETVINELEIAGITYDYYYTDLSQAFLKYARNKFGIKIITKILNIENIGNFEERSFDIILASNVIHATSDVLNSLKKINLLLNEGGEVYLVELVRTAMIYTLIFGITNGWWSYKDLDRRISGSPLLKKNTWFDLFSEANLAPKFERKDEDFEVLGKMMILCGEKP